MNREIKYRFWDRELEKYNFLSLHDLGECDEYWYDGETAVWDVLYDSTHEQKRFIVEQYTGLKDKNGVGVYEGDIVKTDNGSYLYVIAYHHAWYDPLHIIKNECLQVIGNIYEHPERLKESKE